MRADEAVDEAGARWLTHAELAALRGISTASAIKLALRHRWRKQKDNRGTLRCLVPPEWATGKDKRADEGSDTGADTSAAINALQAAMDTLLEAKDSLLEAKDSEIAGLKEAFEIALSAKDSEIVSLRDQFERGIAYLDAERSRADELRGRLDDLCGKLSDAQIELAAAQDQIEALDPGRSRAAGAWRAGAVESSTARRVTAGRRPMADFTVTMDVIKRISEIETPHGKALNDDITEAFPDNPDAAYTLAVGFSVATLLGSFSDPSERANVVDGVNVLVRRMGCALTPVT